MPQPTETDELSSLSLNGAIANYPGGYWIECSNCHIRTPAGFACAGASIDVRLRCLDEVVHIWHRVHHIPSI